MFEIINKARVIWSMLSGKSIRVVRPATQKVYEVQYVTRTQEFEIRENDTIVLRVKLVK